MLTGCRAGANITPNFVTFAIEDEVALTSLNMLTDVLILLIALRLLRQSQRVLTRAIVLPCILVGLTLSIAAVRLTLSIYSLRKTSQNLEDAAVQTNRLIVPFKLFQELDSFFVLFVACLPGLRAWRRKAEERESGLEVAKGPRMREMGVPLDSVDSDGRHSGPEVREAGDDMDSVAALGPFLR